MKSVLLRTGSVPVQLQSFVPGSPRLSLSLHDSAAGFFSGNKTGSASPRILLHLNIGRRSDSTPARGIRRVSSESDVILSETEASRLSGIGSRSFPAIIPEEECIGPIGSLMLSERDFDRRNYAGHWPESGIPVQELGFPGSGGGGDDDDCSTGVSTGGNADRSKIGAYYEEMLKSNPTNSLLLRNYARFLHEVERDFVKAEEYYGRAILASPGDGEVLSLYARLIWETQRNQDRAKSYFDQALHASPNDCMVLGSYAHFMWEADDEDDEIESENDTSATAAAAMVEAF
ncbi:hypothetical protein LOK49_Contig17G00018 [Camellia lanceoleosa]|nr:hypothetical protein LOK49_Contig17G00018 [Camellia lanceoleosa]